jgi:hypothetical protein
MLNYSPQVRVSLATTIEVPVSQKKTGSSARSMYLQPKVLLHAQWLEGGDTDGRLRRFCRPTRIILERAIRIIDKYVEKPPGGQVRFCSIADSTLESAAAVSSWKGSSPWSA